MAHQGTHTVDKRPRKDHLAKVGFIINPFPKWDPVLEKVVKACRKRFFQALGQHWALLGKAHSSHSKGKRKQFAQERNRSRHAPTHRIRSLPTACPVWHQCDEAFTVTEKWQSQTKPVYKYVGGSIRDMGYNEVGISLFRAFRDYLNTFLAFVAGHQWSIKLIIPKVFTG